MREALCAGRPLFAAPNHNSCSTTDDTHSTEPSPRASVTIVRSVADEPFSNAMQALVSRLYSITGRRRDPGPAAGRAPRA